MPTSLFGHLSVEADLSDPALGFLRNLTQCFNLAG